MADKTEVELEKDREAVKAMSGSKGHMERVLSRVSTLESALKLAGNQLRDAKKFVGENCYTYPVSGNSRTVAATLEEQAQAALKHVS